MIFNCKVCGNPVHLRRPDDKPLPEDMKICYECLKKQERKDIKSSLGYSRIGLKNI